MNPALDALTGWLLFGGLALAAGAVIARWAILTRLPSGGSIPEDWLRARVATVGLVGALLLPVALVLYFVRQLGEFRDPFAPWVEDASLLLSTAWGTAWLWASAGAFVATVALLLARAGKGAGWWIATVALVGLASFPAFTGHAAAADARVLALAADTLHVLAAGGWMGGLAVVLYLEWRRRAEGGREASVLPDLVPTFSAVAVVCVATLVVTGTYAAWRELSGWDALFATSWGRTLSLKLVAVAVALALGGLNFRVLTPKLSAASGRAAMRKAASIELLLGQVILIITALLVRTSPMDY